MFDALQLTAPVVAGHSIAGNELSELGIHRFDRIGGLIYLDALNDGSDDWTDYDAVSSKLPEKMRNAPEASPDDMKSFAAYQDWRRRRDGVLYPEAELRQDYAENPDGSVGHFKIPGFVSDAMTTGGYKHDYSRIRVPVLAFVGFPKLPEDQIRQYNIEDPEQRIIVEAVFGAYVGMAENRINRVNKATGGAHVVELWGANHFVFLSNEDEVLREMRAFLDGLR